MVLYILMIILGIVISTITTTKKDEEKQYLEDYKELIRECLKYEDTSKDIIKKRESQYDSSKSFWKIIKKRAFSLRIKK